MRPRRLRNYLGRRMDRVGGLSLGTTPYGGPYLLRDEFITASAAPLTSPRTCEPGPGTLTILDVSNKISISGGRLIFNSVDSGQGAYFAAGVSRVVGRALLALNRPVGLYVSTGFDPTNLVIDNTIGFLAGTGIVVFDYVNAVVIGETVATATDYEGGVVLRSTGAFFLARGGALGSAWKIVWVGVAGTDATVHPNVSVGNNGSSAQIDRFRVLDLPAPWNADYGVSTGRIVGGMATGATFTHAADCLIEWTLTALPSGAETSIAFRVQDASNSWYAQTTNTGDLNLFEQVGGGFTLRGTSAAVVANGDRIVVVADGATIRVYSANTLRITYTGATNFATSTTGKLAANNGGTLSDVVAWPRNVASFIPVGV